MNFIIGFGNLAVGMAYVTLGLLSAWEVASQYRYRGVSRFGLGFSLMAASCGPHHLVHGMTVLQGGIVSAPMLAVTLTGIPAGAVFCWLRFESMRKGRGDRTLAVNGSVMAGAVVLSLAGASLLAGWAMATQPEPGLFICTSRSIATLLDGSVSDLSPFLVFFSNLWASLAYAMVGWYLADTQIRRYVANRSWSLSGLALSGVFPSCAAMHLILALTSSSESATLPFDLLGIPASVYFLWVVKRLHANSAVDWNYQPLAGVAATPKRMSPWRKV